jgi:hypothetical protein
MYYVIAIFREGILRDIADDPASRGVLCTENKYYAERVKKFLKDNGEEIFEGSSPIFEVIKHRDLSLPTDVFCPEGLINVRWYSSTMVYVMYYSNPIFRDSMEKISWLMLDPRE